MKKMNIALFTFLFLLIEINSQVPNGKVINTCGKLGYDQPSGKDDCYEKEEICCYVKIQDKENNKDPISFCVTSPKEIEIDDVKSEILEYTGFNILELACINKGGFIKTSFEILLFIIFVIF